MLRHLYDGAKPGMVTYTEYETIIAEADEKLAEKLSAKQKNS